MPQHLLKSERSVRCPSHGGKFVSLIRGRQVAAYHSVVAWDPQAEICGRYLGKAQQVAIEGRLQTRSWDDDPGAHQCQVSPSA
jgi:single-stranded DNA-binding protein